MSKTICRFLSRANGAPSYGLIDGDTIFAVSPAQIFDDATPAYVPSVEGVALSEVKLLAPVEPSKIVCVGRNYREHAAASARVEHEGELGVVIGRRARLISDSENPLDYVLGYTCVNDVTARDLQRQDVQFTRAKSFDTFCPVGPYIVTGIDPLDLELETRVNGETRQRGRTAAMAFPVAYLIRYISHIMTLEAGDVISTGTPSGVGPLSDGDICEIEVEHVGVLRNTVRSAA
jgi:2-keto-4-pentenoate hydratase/2-oxohepta-3-ene-1,7-dioic acid hydratase in catechol pathway